jgi:MFS family permease
VPARDRLRRLALDVTPLRVSPAFRRLWLGLLVSSTGSQFTLVAVFIQLTERTASTIAVGTSGLAYLVGVVAGTLAFGPVIDAWDRRRLLVLAQLGTMAAVAILLFTALVETASIALIYVGIALASFFGALDSPTRSALTPRLIGDELIPSAAALNQVVWNGSGLLGPAIAGVTVKALGLLSPTRSTWCRSSRCCWPRSRCRRSSPRAGTRTPRDGRRSAKGSRT